MIEPVPVGPLPPPVIVRCEFDDGFTPPLAVMCLRWVPGGPAAQQRWRLPGGACMTGPAPTRFGISIVRPGVDAYSVHLVWNHTRLSWPALPREELRGSDLSALLDSLGTDLLYLLDQPVGGRDAGPKGFVPNGRATLPPPKSLASHGAPAILR